MIIFGIIIDFPNKHHYYVDMIKRENMIEDQMETILELLTGLNDRTRQGIVLIFKDKKEYCVNDIAKKFDLTRPTISHHLNLMKKSKILVSRKEGKEIYYSFNKDYVLENLEMLSNLIKGCC